MKKTYVMLILFSGYVLKIQVLFLLWTCDGFSPGQACNSPEQLNNNPSHRAGSLVSEYVTISVRATTSIYKHSTIP